MTMQVPVDLARMGFKLAEAKKPSRLMINVEAFQKTGKTSFIMTAPKPILYMNFDKSSEEDMGGRLAGQPIYIKNYWPASSEQDACKKTIDEFHSNYRDALSTASIRTIAIDTGSELWEMKRMADFGKLTQVMPIQYSRANMWYRALFNDALQCNKNIIITHKLKKEYMDNDWSGKYEAQGFSQVPYLVHVSVRLSREEKPPYLFRLSVNECTQNALIKGMELTSDPRDLALNMVTFPWLAINVFPGTLLEDWA